MPIPASAVLSTLPTSLRDELLAEYRSICQNYAERRWSPTEMSGGRFCEVVYSVLDGHAKGAFPASASKPLDFVGACRTLERNTGVPRSFQILIPRLLPALFEIRNNRGVGHVGGDVDPNHMDATAVLGMSSWVMAELIRVFHNIATDQAQQVVDSLVERRIPLIWQESSMKRVLDPSLALKESILLLASSCPGAVQVSDLLKWTEYKDRKYFVRSLRNLHSQRLVELAADLSSILVLPPGAALVGQLLAKRLAS